MIFYFSGTGNSLYVARLLADELNDCIISIPDCINNGTFEFELKDSEKIGIVTPVYFYGLPSIVETFLDKLNLKKYSSFYLVVTFGSFTANTGPNAQKYFSGLGLNLDHIFSVKMPENYVPLLKVPSQDVCSALISDAQKSVHDIVKILDENPGKKSTQTAKDKIGENVYYSVFTSQINEALNSDNAVYYLKEGDIITVTVKNTNLTLSQSLKNFFYTISGNDTYTIAASSGGLILTTGTQVK